MSSFDVYIWLKLDDIQMSIFIISALLFCADAALVTDYFCENKKSNKLIAWSVTFAIIMLMAALTLIPSTKQYAMMRVFPVLTNSEIAKELPQNSKELYDMAKEYLKEKLTTGDPK